MRGTAVLLALLLAACGAPPVAERAAATSQTAAVGLTPDAAGLQPRGSALRIDFGRAEVGVVAAVTRLLGAQPVAIAARTGCPDGVDMDIAWPSGLTLSFRQGTFVGWRDGAGGAAGATCGAA